MIIQFTLRDLMVVLISVLGIAAGIILLSILWNIRSVVSNLRHLVETNKESIKRTISTMPGIFENVGQISNNVRETTEKLSISLPVILHEAECITSAAKGSVELGFRNW
jgi:predicted PurR-regulated permease PerM